MASFDLKAYEDEVLKPLRKRLPHLPDDLLTRYAVRLDMTETELRERVKAVVAHWNKVAMRAGSLALVCQHLQRAHEQHLKDDPEAFVSPAWWKDKDKARHQELGPEIADLAAQLKASYGGLGLITRSQLRGAAAAHGKLGDADLDQARRAAALELVEPLELPTSAGTSGQFGSLSTKLLAAGVDSIARLVYPQLTDFGVLGGFTVTPAPPPGWGPALSDTALKQRGIELDKLPDGTAVRAGKEAVGFLRTELKAGTDLAALTLFHLLSAVREKRAEGAEARPLFTLLTQTGLRAADAGRIAVSLLAEGAVRRDPLADVMELLTEGSLLAAQQIATTLAGPDGAAAREAVDRRREQVDTLRRKAKEDLAAGRHEQAGEWLREAMLLASDLPGLAAELASVPAPPVRAVTANSDGGGVRIAWRPAPGHDDATAFRVVRRDGRVPADADDGQEIPVRSAHSTVDETPPVGRRLHYAVFARVAARQWSRPESAVVQVVPPVTDVVVEGGENVVVGRWRTHPDVVAVEVTRASGVPDGRGEPVAVERNRAFRDMSVRDGVRYHYTVVACYPAGTGLLRSEPVIVRGATRPEARPVTSLAAVPWVGGAGLAVRLSWRQRTGSEIVIRRSAQPCPWQYGQAVAPGELASYGHELDGARTEKGESVTLIAPVPPGRSYFVPFTMGPRGGMRGQDAVVDLTEQVSQVRAQRFGEDIKVTWLWPAEVSAADVVWPGGKCRITRQQYRDGGGCQIRGAPGVTRVEVGAVVLGELGEEGSGESRSPATSVEVEQRPPQLRYEIRKRGHRLAGGVKCIVTVTGADQASEVTVVLVAAIGRVMPLTADTGIELIRATVVVGLGTPGVLPEVVVPRVLRKPYWLRCFLAEPVTALLVDPPVSQLKVS
jgi:hypothetical protein